MMPKLLQPRRLATVAALTLVWCSLWGDLAAGTVIAGLAVATVVTSIGVGPSFSGKVRLGPLSRLVAVVVADLVRSTAAVASEVLTPTDYTDEAIIAVPVSDSSRHHMFFLVSAITLTPGTTVVDADRDEGVLYLHLLHADRRG